MANIKTLNEDLIHRANSVSFGGKRGDLSRSEYTGYAEKILGWPISDEKKQKLLDKLYDKWTEILRRRDMSKKQSRKANLNPKIREIAESLEWTVREYDDGTVEFEKYSPAGEDFIFTVNAENAETEIYDYYDSFDVDDHIEMWVKAKENGVAGVPSIRRIVEDAEAISEMLKELAGAVDTRTTIGEQLAAVKENNND